MGIKEINVSTVERRVEVILSDGEFVIIRPTGNTYKMNVSSKVDKEYVRYIANYVARLPYFKSKNLIYSDVKEAKEQLKKFVGDQIPELLN